MQPSVHMLPLRIMGAGKKRGGSTLPIPIQRVGVPLSFSVWLSVHSCPPPFTCDREREWWHTPPFCVHISARRGERGGMRKNGWVGPSAEKRGAKAKREGRTEGEGIGAPHACGGVNAALTAPSAARILEEEEGIGGLFVPPCWYTHCLRVIFTCLSLLKKV